MTDITKLPDYYRALSDTYLKPLAEYGNDMPQFLLRQFADELEAALPVWTKITDHPDTWPPTNGASVISSEWSEAYQQWNHRLVTFSVDDALHSFEHEVRGMFCWRPLCDLDYPPKDAS